MNDSTTKCTEVEGLLPLYVGADLEKDQLELVAEHLEECSACTIAFSRTREARGLLRAELVDLVDGREPQLWPALREQLQAEGLFKQAAGGVSEGSESVLSKDGEGALERVQPNVAPIIPGNFGRRRAARVASLAAGITAVFFLGKMLPGSSDLGPVTGENLVSTPETLEGPGFNMGSAPEGLLADAAVEPEAAIDSPLNTLESSAGGLRPMLLGEQSLADVVRENLRQEAEANAGSTFFLVPQGPMAGQGGTQSAPVGLASDFSLQ